MMQLMYGRGLIATDFSFLGVLQFVLSLTTWVSIIALILAAARWFWLRGER